MTQTWPLVLTELVLKLVKRTSREQRVELWQVERVILSANRMDRQTDREKERERYLREA